MPISTTNTSTITRRTSWRTRVSCKQKSCALLWASLEHLGVLPFEQPDHFARRHTGAEEGGDDPRGEGRGHAGAEDGAGALGAKLQRVVGEDVRLLRQL